MTMYGNVIIVCKPVNSATPFAFALRPVTESEANFNSRFRMHRTSFNLSANSE